MASGPLYITRSYGGGAVVAQLQQTMEAGDLSFALSTTTGWTDINGNPLGTTGPFTVVIDRFTDTVEKILCTSVNLTTGVVQVYNSGGFSGRGYDGTTAQAHVPSGSTSGVQTCWSSVEAFEANAAVSYVLGDAGGTPSNGQVLTWNGTTPEWAANTPTAGVSAARMYNTGGGVIANGTPTQITGMVEDFSNGGITFASNGLTVPVNGKYQASWAVGYNSGGGVVGGGYYNAMLYQNGSLERQMSLSVASATAEPVIGTSDLIAATAGDVFTLYGQQGSGGTEGISAGSDLTWLSLQLVSTP